MNQDTRPGTVGIIAEYNPFHNGHLYQLKTAKRMTGAAYCIVIMSGSFVQRGTPAFIDKMSRTRMALENGADLVLELPVRYATSSAEFFSTGAVSLLENLGVVDYLCFGSESGNLPAMKEIAEYIQKDCHEFNKSIAFYTKNGYSYPEARQKSLLNHFKEMDSSLLNEIISSPNNILGIEYLKALCTLKSTIEPATVKRAQTGYHDPSLAPAKDSDHSIHSATAIRNRLEQNLSLDAIAESVPDSVLKILQENEAFPITSRELSDMLYYAIVTQTEEKLACYQDITPDLARTIKNHVHEFENYEQYIQVLKSKQYTYTRISRCLLHILLGIPEYSIKGIASENIVPYARILGFRKDSSCLLKQIKENGTIPLITKMADAKDILSPSAYQMLEEDIFATGLYNRLVFKCFHQKNKNDIQTSPVIL